MGYKTGRVLPRRVGLPLLIVMFLAACSAFPQSVPPTATTAPGASPTLAATGLPVTGDTAMPSATPDTGMGGMATPSGKLSPLIQVADQPLSGGSVMVDDVVSDGPGWVVIYTINSSGQPDQPIGHAAVKDGDNKNVMVPVDPAKASGTLYAQLHSDAGQVGVFEFPGADAPLMVGVQMIAHTFKVLAETASAGPTATPGAASGAASGAATAAPTPTTAGMAGMGGMGGGVQGDNAGQAGGVTPGLVIGNQPIVNSAVVVAQVTVPKDSWVVIHRMNGDGSMGEMVGFARVAKGDTRNVVVPVDTGLTSATMAAMLHEDVANLSSPQFPGVDVPVEVNGQMIAPLFQVTGNGSADIFVGLGNTATTTNYLVDGRAMTLYLSLQDTPSKSNCSGDCLNDWRPLLATGRIIAGEGVPAKNLGVILRPDGSRQVTYSGAPLYTYAKDNQPGDVNGQGVEGNWYLVAP